MSAKVMDAQFRVVIKHTQCLLITNKEATESESLNSKYLLIPFSAGSAVFCMNKNVSFYDTLCVLKWVFLCVSLTFPFWKPIGS